MKCEICNKRESVKEFEDTLPECDYCFINYINRKMYRCSSPDFISNKWVLLAYKLHVPYQWIEATYGRLRFI